MNYYKQDLSVVDRPRQRWKQSQKNRRFKYIRNKHHRFIGIYSQKQIENNEGYAKEPVIYEYVKSKNKNEL